MGKYRENNLKPLYAPNLVSTALEELENFDDFDYEVVCDVPNEEIEKFHGKILFGDQEVSLSKSNLILRGSIVRNTEFVVGLAIYTGMETKLGKNNGKYKRKMTNLMNILNMHLIIIIIMLGVTILILVVSKVIWEKLYGEKFRVYSPNTIYRNPNKNLESFVLSLLSFFSLLIILNAIIPISLFVSIDLIHFVNSLFINWDQDLQGPSLESARSRSTELIEDLGQVTHFFTDKTGTLTQNIMKLVEFSVEGTLFKLEDKTNIMNMLKGKDSKLDLFFKIISICNTIFVHTDKKTGKIQFQAQSTDEKALVEFASDFEYVLQVRDSKQLTISIWGKPFKCEILAVLEFDPVRKRMSIVVRRKSTIFVFCKGADSAIYDVLEEHQTEKKKLIEANITTFATRGYRTLCYAYKILSESEWNTWNAEYKEAMCAMGNQEDRIIESYKEIEKNLILVGCTGIEDKLQDKVPETINKILHSKIQIWMLTGDKMETAINISYSCGLVRSTDLVRHLTEKDKDMVEKQLIDFNNYVYDELLSRGMTLDCYLTEMGKIEGEYSDVRFSLAISGIALSVILKYHRELFVTVIDFCTSIICCRMTPRQKAEIVELVQKSKKGVTMSVGDGGNDVNMIRVAKVGVGIYGLEGRQAVLNSDYSIAQFKFVDKLIFFHGRLAYLRLSKFIKYFIYKSFAYAFQQAIFAFFTGFSAQNVFNQNFVALVNLLYTTGPITVLAVFEKDTKQQLDHPTLFQYGKDNKLYNYWTFACSVTEGFLTSLMIVISSYLTFNNTISPKGYANDDIELFRHAVMTITIFVLNLRCAITLHSWNIINVLSILLSIFVFFALTILFNDPIIASPSIGALYILYKNPSFWFLLLLNLGVMMIPVLFIKALEKKLNLKQYKSVFRKISDSIAAKVNGFSFSTNISYRGHSVKILEHRMRKQSKIINNIMENLPNKNKN